jgi:hypothetical protein
MKEGQFTEHIIVRVPRAMKQAFASLSYKKTKKEAELAREAFTNYFEALGINAHVENGGLALKEKTEESSSMKRAGDEIASEILEKPSKKPRASRAK